LNAEVAEAADALHGDQITGAGSGIAQSVENRDAGAEQRRSVGRWKIVRDSGYRFGRRDHVFLIPAVVTDAGNFLVLAIDKIAAAAGLAGEIVAAVPSDAYALAGLPVGNVGADGIDVAGDFVSGDSGILDAGPKAFFYEGIAMADAASFNFNSYLVASGIWNVSFDHFEIGARLGGLDGFHF
jgi:hypothetical protein